jgi:hypothetical protein
MQDKGGRDYGQVSGSVMISLLFVWFPARVQPVNTEYNQDDFLDFSGAIFQVVGH